MVLGLGCTMGCTMAAEPSSDAASPPDAGADGAARDAVTPDAPAHDVLGARPDVVYVGTDASHDGLPDDPEWIPMPVPASACQMQRALHPERVLAYSWTDCGAGCRELVTSPPGLGAGFWPRGPRTAMTFLVPDDVAPILVLAELDGPVLGAWRFPRTLACGWASLAAGEGRAALVAWGRGPSAEAQVWIDDLDRLGTLDAPTQVVDGDAMGSIFVGSGVVALGGPPQTFAIDALGTEELPVWTVYGVAGDTVLASTVVLGCVDNDVLVTTPGHDPTTLLRGYVVPWTDGTNLVWIESHDVDPSTGHFGSQTLWTSPFVTDPTALVPVAVRELGSTTAATALGHPFVARLASGTGEAPIEVIDVRDGTVRTFAISGSRDTLLGAISPTELFVEAYLTSLHVRRYAIDAIPITP